ncbi:MAG: hypothetical protein ACXWRE_02780 [Pseudobdellovibrionaceae bacterium]
MEIQHVNINKSRSNYLQKNGPLNNQKGNAVLLILAAIIVGGVILETAGFGRIAQNSFFSSSSRIKESRDTIAFQIERYATLPATFRNSIGFIENAELQNCVLGNGLSLCIGDGATEFPLKLYAPVLSSAGSQLIAAAGPAGTAVQPVLYDTKGNLCQTGDTSASLACPFEVSTTFVAWCPTGTTTCAIADCIQVHYVIRIPDFILSMTGMKEKAVLAKVDKFSTDIKTKDILPPPVGYVANINKVNSMVAVQSGTTPTTTMSGTAATYEQMLAAVQTLWQGTPYASQATDFATLLYNGYSGSIKDLSLVPALANFWIQNSALAGSFINLIQWDLTNKAGFTITATQISNIAAAVSGISDPLIASAIANALVDNVATAQAIAAAAAGITNKDALGIIASMQETNAAIAQAFALAMNTNAFTMGASWGVGYAFHNLGITDYNSVAPYISVIIQAGTINADVAYAIISQKVTDVQQAKDMQAAYTANPTTIASASPTSTSTSTSPTSPTVTPTPTPMPVALSPICDPTTCPSAPSSF